MLAMAFAVVVLNGLIDRGPKFHGKSANAWVKELGSPGGNKGQAMNALLRLGCPESGPHLISALESQGTPGYRSLWPKLPDSLRKHLPDPNARLYQTRYHAVVVLKEFGTSASGAIPALVHLLDEPNPSFRCNVIAALGEIGPNDSAAISALRKMAEDKDPFIRSTASAALAKASSKPKD